MNRHTPKIATEDIAIAKSSVAKFSGYHHHHLGDYDYVEDVDEDSKIVMILMIMMNLVSVFGNLIGPMWAVRMLKLQLLMLMVQIVQHIHPS